MMLLGALLLLLQQGDSFAPVTTVELGAPVVFTCALPQTQISHRELCWYKQVAGDSLQLIVILRKSTRPSYSDEYPDSRVKVEYDQKFTNLTILRTVPEDEGMYHCAVTEWIRAANWTGHYLIVRGNSKRTSNYTVVQPSSVSGPVRPGDSMTLQCSVLSDRENNSCPEGPSVFWFRAGSDGSHPDVMYTDGSSGDGCEESSEPQRSCVYGLSKTFSSSDAGTYYCAVATCGRILMGPGQEVVIGGYGGLVSSVVVSLLCSALGLSLIVIAVLVCAITKNDTCDDSSAAELNGMGGWRSEQLRVLKREKVYSAVVFMNTVSRAGRGAAEREKIYAAVKAFGLDQ